MNMTRSYGVRPARPAARPEPKRPVAGEYQGRVIPVGKVPIILSARKSDIIVSVANEGKAFLYVGDAQVDAGSGAIIEPGEYASFDVPRAEDLYGVADGETKVRITEYTLEADKTGAPVVILSGPAGDGGEGGPHTHPEYQHTHPYAPEVHSHPEYEHTHPYASDTHNHDAAYAALVHSHEGGGAHDHDATYSALTHNHDGTYAPTHSHPYASDTHNHDAAYSGTGHTHDTSHNHDGVYAPTHSHPYADADHGAHLTSGQLTDLTDGGETALHSHSGGGGHPDLAAHDTLGLATQTELDNHAAAADPHTGYVREADADWVDLTDGGQTALHSHAGGGGGGDSAAAVVSADVANSSNSTAVTAISLADLGPGTYLFKAWIAYKTVVTTTGIEIWANHTGTVTRFLATWYTLTTGGAAATGVADQATTLTAQMMEGKGQRAKDVASGPMQGTDTSNADQFAVMEGIAVVTATGSFELKFRSEVNASAATILAGTVIEFRKAA